PAEATCPPGIRVSISDWAGTVRQRASRSAGLPDARRASRMLPLIAGSPCRKDAGLRTTDNSASAFSSRYGTQADRATRPEEGTICWGGCAGARHEDGL